MNASGARIDSHQLFNGHPGRRSGAAFYLVSRPSFTADWERGDGWTASVNPGSRCVVARGTSSSDHAAIWHEAHAVVQEALDVWSFSGKGDLATENPFGNHLVFWDDARGPVVRIASRGPLNVRLSATAVVHDAQGKPQPPTMPADNWHPSMRFFRQSQISDDLFESLRDLWLAFENLLDFVEPQREENEEKWLRRALKAASGIVALSSYMPAADGSTGTLPADHNRAFDYFYSDLRTELFHAKGSRNPILPNDATRVRDLAVRHSQLSSLYIELTRAVTGVARGGSALTFAGFDLMTAGLVENNEVRVTDDLAPFDANDVEVAPGGGVVVGGPAARAPDLEGPGLRVVVGEVPGAELRQLHDARISRIVLMAADQPLLAILPDGELFLPGVACLETQHEFSLVNATTAKRFVGY